LLFAASKLYALRPLRGLAWVAGWVKKQLAGLILRWVAAGLAQREYSPQKLELQKIAD